MENKKVALVLLPLFWPNMPPMGLAMLKGYLVRHGIKVRCFDLNNLFYNKGSFDLKKEWRKSCNISLEEKVWGMIKKDFSRELNNVVNEIIQYDIVGLSVYKSNLKTVREFIRMIKEIKPQIKIVLGGPEISRKYFDLGESILDEFGPERVIDSPISEAGITGLAVGAAMTGMRPVVDIMFGDFLYLIIIVN